MNHVFLYYTPCIRLQSRFGVFNYLIVQTFDANNDKCADIYIVQHVSRNTHLRKTYFFYIKIVIYLKDTDNCGVQITVVIFSDKTVVSWRESIRK